jgi:hypothetical protein
VTPSGLTRRLDERFPFCLDVESLHVEVVVDQRRQVIPVSLPDHLAAPAPSTVDAGVLRASPRASVDSDRERRRRTTVGPDATGRRAAGLASQ